MPPLPVDAPSADTARLVALADRCVQCGLCLPHCPTYRLDRIEAEGPRGRIAYARALADGSLEPTDAGDRHLDHCLGCRRCESACPAGVQYEALLIGARTLQRERRGPTLAERATLATLASPALARVALPLARLAGRLPALPPEPAVGGEVADLHAPKGQLAIFWGCVAQDYEAGTRRALATLVAKAGWQVMDIVDQGCCGTAAAHAGDAPAAAGLAERNRIAFAALPATGPNRTVLSLASGCQSILAASLAGVAEVVDAFAFLDLEGAPLRFRPADARVALHLPCSQRVLGNDAPLRRLLARIPGLDLVELPDTGCCGAAGMHMLSEPARAAALRAPLLAALATSGATRLLSANVGCRLHLANAATVPVRHPVDFLAEHLA
jgi:glycolate oxidase iron-sulfur subunit